ncbi:MAG: hypothetical protein ACJAZS_000782 [Alteromonas naphthalenivorans]|jgi:hypothetical protein
MKIKFSIALVLFAYTCSLQALTTLNYNDVSPPFSSKYHFDFMNEEEKEILKEKDIKGIYERVQISTSFVGQKATRARDVNKVKVFVGDVHGRLNMIGLTYGALPTGQTKVPLITAAETLNLVTLTGATVGNDTYSDLNQNFGFFALPVKYRKVAGRFKVSIRLLDDFVLSVQGGVADMKQTLTLYEDRTTSTNPIDVFKNNINATDANFIIDKSTVDVSIMNKRVQIFTEMGVNGEDWHKTGAEDFSLSLAWRHNFRMNKEEDPEDWARFIFTPHFLLAGTFGVGSAQDPDVLLSLPFGNNKHDAIHLASGFSADFHETIEVSFEAGGTHFFNRTYVTRVPTSEFQSLLFPYKTTVKVEPGQTWHATFGMNAHHFLDKLSLFAQYSYIQHIKDDIKLVTADTAFIPRRLEDQTTSKVQNARIGFNYDLSPNMSFGFVWQAPIAQRASYKTTTILLSAIMTF